MLPPEEEKRMLEEQLRFMEGQLEQSVTAAEGDLNAPVDPRFGRYQYFVFVDSDTMAFEAMPNDAIAAPGGAGIQAAQTVVNKGVDVLISGNIGPNAFQVLSAAGVRVATGAYGTVKEAVEIIKAVNYAR